jgi:hypothetical protein
MITADSLAVIVLETYAAAAVLASRAHEIWARFFSGTALSLSRYNTSDCFETFPFPAGYDSSFDLEQAGRNYFEFRASLMIRNNEGLTKTYNRFHDPNEESTDICRLRDLHAATDRAVLNAYGWKDLQPICHFFPEFDDEEDEGEDGRPRRKKHRYRWPDDVRDDVLARLLELNTKLALEEGQIASESQALQPGDKKKKSNRKRTKINSNSMDQIVIELGEA